MSGAPGLVRPFLGQANHPQVRRCFWAKTPGGRLCPRGNPAPRSRCLTGTSAPPAISLQSPPCRLPIRLDVLLSWPEGNFPGGSKSCQMALAGRPR